MSVEARVRRERVKRSPPTLLPWFHPVGCGRFFQKKMDTSQKKAPPSVGSLNKISGLGACLVVILGFAWLRFGSFLASSGLLLSPRLRQRAAPRLGAGARGSRGAQASDRGPNWIPQSFGLPFGVSFKTPTNKSKRVPNSRKDPSLAKLVEMRAGGNRPGTSIHIPEVVGKGTPEGKNTPKDRRMGCCVRWSEPFGWSLKGKPEGQPEPFCLNLADPTKFGNPEIGLGNPKLASLSFPFRTLDGMGWDGMGWDGMGWDGMGWDGMGWGGVGWGGVGWGGGRMDGGCMDTSACLRILMQTPLPKPCFLSAACVCLCFFSYTAFMVDSEDSVPGTC